MELHRMMGTTATATSSESSPMLMGMMARASSKTRRWRQRGMMRGPRLRTFAIAS